MVILFMPIGQKLTVMMMKIHMKVSVAIRVCIVISVIMVLGMPASN